MMNKSFNFKRILAMILVICTMLGFAPAMAESYTAIAADGALAVYKDAALSQKITDLARYTLVKVSAVKDDVAKLKYQGYTVYADAGDLASVQEIAIEGAFTQDSRVFESPDLLSRSGAVSKGLKVNVLYINGDWAMIERSGSLGFAYAEHLAPVENAAEPDTEKEPDEDPFLPEATPEVQPEADASGVTIETVGAKVNVASLPVYKSATTASKKLGTMKYGQQVTVYAYNDSWAYIGLNGKFGFTALAGLTRTTNADADDNKAEIDLSNAIPATVTAESVKVYKSASAAADTLGTLKKGVQVNVVKTNGDWACIELKGKLGYCALAALTKTSDLKPEEEDSDAVIGDKNPLGTATVIVASVPVYDSMKADAPIGTLSMGETLNYYGYDSKWVLVGRDGSFGFVQRKYLNADAYAELEADDTGDGVKEMESALLALGYLDSVPSTTYTGYTTQAVSRLQDACGMTSNGKADTATLRVLFSGNAPASPLLSTSLSKGDKGGNVQRIQTRLHALGYLSKESSIDSEYGATTANAIALFQKAAGGSATGEANTATIQALYSANAPKLPSGVNAADASGSISSGSQSSGNSTSISSGLASTVDKYVSGMSNAQKLEYVIYNAQEQLGKKYVFGASGTATFDCSGLTMYCFKKIGVNLAHSAYTQGYGNTYQKVSSSSSLRRGDLVFFNTMSDGDSCDHVGIYLGNDYFIHASSGAGKVVVSDMGSGYYSRVYSWGRRILSA